MHTFLNESTLNVSCTGPTQTCGVNVPPFPLSKIDTNKTSVWGNTRQTCDEDNCPCPINVNSSALFQNQYCVKGYIAIHLKKKLLPNSSKVAMPALPEEQLKWCLQKYYNRQKRIAYSCIQVTMSASRKCVPKPLNSRHTKGLPSMKVI